MEELEAKLFNMIKELYNEIVEMKPKDGFCSPRDFGLVADVNKKTAILDNLQDAMRIINPQFEIRR